METVYTISIMQAWETSKGLLILMTVCLMIVALAKVIKSYPNRKMTMFMGGAMCVAASMWLIMYISGFFYYMSLFYTKNYEILEGVISVKRIQPKSRGRPAEVIVLAGREVEFSYFSDYPGYHKTINNGGILTNGSYVRLFIVKENIMRIDIRK